jgi:hypothetical protein
MDREQIIEWSLEADIDWHKHWNDDESNRLEAFAKLVAVHERKAIAAMVKPLDESLADEILARGNNA